MLQKEKEVEITNYLLRILDLEETPRLMGVVSSPNPETVSNVMTKVMVAGHHVEDHRERVRANPAKVTARHKELAAAAPQNLHHKEVDEEVCCGM